MRPREQAAAGPKSVAGTLPLAAGNLFLLGSLREVLVEAGKKGIPVIVLKGAAFLSWLYDDPGQRPMGDLDILVPPERLRETEAVLEALGYARASGTVEAFRRGSVVVDVHTRLVYRRDSAPVWGAAVACSVEGVEALMLDPDETFIHLVGRSLLQGGCMEPRYVEDMRRLAATAGKGGLALDWEAVVGKAAEVGLKPLLYAALVEMARRSPGEEDVRPASTALPGARRSPGEEDARHASTAPPEARRSGSPRDAGRAERPAQAPGWVLEACKPVGAGRLAAWLARRAAALGEESYFYSACLFLLVRPDFVLGRLFPGREFLERRYGKDWRWRAALRPFTLAARALWR